MRASASDPAARPPVERTAGTRRGTLKIFVGMAAGVGKTVAMLREGHDRRAEGQDIVIGWVEPHGRAETAALAEGLEALAPLRVRYRSMTLEELDLAGVLARRPEVALVDELAHTNAPGLAHAKRWEDVHDLLDAGIDVLSTMNVQHLESLNDRVYELTGVRVRETIPDRVVLEAEEVVLVDLTPEALQARLREGKIYPADRIDRALLNFFTTRNLGALREVALREVADAVDEQMMRTPDRPQNGPAIAERVMVVARCDEAAQRLIRRAWRGARRLSAELDIAVPEPRGAEAEEVMARMRALAVDLGAHFLRVPSGAEMVDEIARLAAARGVTRIVLRPPPRRGFLARARERDLAAALLERLEGVEILLVPGGGERTSPEPR